MVIGTDHAGEFVIPTIVSTFNLDELDNGSLGLKDSEGNKIDLNTPPEAFIQSLQVNKTSDGIYLEYYNPENTKNILIVEKENLVENILTEISEKDFKPEERVTPLGVSAKLKLTELEEAKYPCQDYEKAKLKPRISINSDRILFFPPKEGEEESEYDGLDLQRLRTGFENYTYDGERIRVLYMDSREKKNILLFTPDQALDIAGFFPSSKDIRTKITYQREDDKAVSYDSPRKEDGVIRFSQGEDFLPKNIKSPLTRRFIVDNDGNYFAILLASSRTNRTIALKVSLDDYNKLLEINK